MKFKLIAAAGIVFMLSSCQKVLLSDTPSNTPLENFTELWEGYQHHYGLFNVRPLNWDSLYAKYKPQVTNNLTNQQLYGVLTNMITPLNDIHVFLQPTGDGLARYESSTFFRNHKVQDNFSVNVVRQSYLPSLKSINEKFHYGILNGNIGYIHFGAFDLPASFYAKQLDKVMDELKNTKGIIIDIRDHEGGDDKVSKSIAGRFAKEEKLFMTVRKKSGKGRNEFTPPESWYVNKEGSFQYTKPLILLTSEWTASAGETFTWAMNTQLHVTQLGTTTAGGFSDVISRELPNGWIYTIPVGDYRNAAGISEEGKGIVPKIVKSNTKQNIDAGQDKVLEDAILKL